MSRSRTAAGLVLAAGLLAACSSTASSTPSASPSSSDLAVPVTPSTQPPTPAPSTSMSTPAAPTTSRPAPSTPATHPSTPPKSTSVSTHPGGSSPECTSARLTLQVQRGGAVLGKEYAAVVVTNSSSTMCVLSGYPTAQLLTGGQAVGAPSVHASGTERPIALAAHRSAQSQLTATTTCQAPVSDHVRITLPAGGALTGVLTVRACAVQVSPFAPS